MKYTLEELLKDAPETPRELTQEDLDWLNMPDVGKEIIEE